MKLGIGVVTYNRKARLLKTFEKLLHHTKTPATWVIADDGSPDATARTMRWEYPDVPVISGDNRGVCWNRNRALWWLHVVKRCDVSILIEDDTWPTIDGWEQDWIDAAIGWGHANLDGEWFRDGVVHGAGTVKSPAVSRGVSGQCSSFSREPIDIVGFYDPRFNGYGGGHVEHTERLIRAGFGGQMLESIPESYHRWQAAPETATLPLAPLKVQYWLLRSPLHIDDEGSHRSAETQSRNNELRRRTICDPVHRMPWRTDADMSAFLKEIEDTKTGKGHHVSRAPNAEMHVPPRLEVVV